MSNFMDKISHKLSGKDSHHNYSSDDAQGDYREGKQRSGQQQQRAHDTYGTSQGTTDDAYGHQQGMGIGQQEQFGSTPQSRGQYSSGQGATQMRGNQPAGSGYQDQSLGGSGFQTQDTMKGNRMGGDSGMQQQPQTQFSDAPSGRQTRSQGAPVSAGLGAQEEWSESSETNQFSKKAQQQGKQAFNRGMDEGDKYVNRNL